MPTSMTLRRTACAAALLVAVALPAAPAGGAQAATYRSGPATASATATAHAAAAAGRLYAGSTTHGVEPLVLEVRGGRLTRVVAEYGGPCFAFGNQSTGAQIRSARVSRAGRVTATVRTRVTASTNLYANASSRAVSVTETISARIGATRATGSVQAKVTFADGSTCTSDRQTFVIRHRAGRVFGGATSQEMPVVLELTDDGTSIRHFHVGWVAECADGSFSVVPDYLVDFPLGDGRWGDVFQQSYQAADLRWTLRYDVTGTLRRTSGSGRMSVDIGGVDAAGAVQEGCNTRVFTFSVRT